MTRLIDGDALERAIYEWMPKDQETWMDSKIPPNENLVVSIMMTIQEQQPVDAIPIEFIKSEIARMKEGLNPHHPECAIYAEDLGILIEEWEGSKKEYETD